MRLARSLSVAILSLVVVAGCATSSAGWTYVPASMTPQPSSAASGSPSASASAPSGSGNPTIVNISALGIKYEQTTLTAPAGTPFQVVFENKDAGVPHNVTLHLGGATGATLFTGPVFNGVATRTYDVPALDAGQYAFVCIVHPTMIGTLNVQ
jgi:plastocyanin